MHFEPDQIYHVYNRGNDKQHIFFTEANYIYFLSKIKTEWKKYCDVLCYCLMPNHFHFMLVPNEEGCKNIILSGKDTHMQNLSKIIGKTLSSYTQAINIQNKTTGNLFQKKTKAKLLTEVARINELYTIKDYILTCFHYIHHNPLKAGLVKRLTEWPYSSYLDYYNQRNGTICNKSLTMQLLELSEIDFKSEDNYEVKDDIIKRLF
ncbi:MAG: transposase [Chitinophagaceae bacterium]|nr:transposase [Chitinophagaceae bacterium]MBK7557121.1 transposase [Chitinophagaceae bacterium]